MKHLLAKYLLEFEDDFDRGLALLLFPFLLPFFCVMKIVEAVGRCARKIAHKP